MILSYRKFFTTIIFFTLLISFSFAQPPVKSGVPGACGYSGNSNNKNPSPLNGNGSLGQSFNQSACGLNYVAATAHVETRYYGATGTLQGCGLPCSWSISGLPTCIVPVQALVWVLGSYTEANPPAASITITNPLSNTATYSTPGLAGKSGIKCWGETGTFVYRFDVTASIANNGTYAFNFSGFSNPTWEIDGATIFIIYRDLSATYDGSLIFWDGASASTGGTLSQTLTGFNVCATPSTATAFMITSDHQPNVAATHNSEMNGIVYSFPNSFSNFQVKSTTLTAGQTTSAFYDSNSGTTDCFLWGMAGLYYQSNCTSCTPNALIVNQSSTPAACGNNNGTATATASGGNPPFTYTWSPAVAGNTNTATGLAPGTYNVTVCDGPGCCTAVTIVVGSSTAPTVTAASTPAGCTVANGTATANPTGGTAPYSYSWNSAPVQNTQTANNLPSGTYVVTVTDNNGCTTQTSVVVGGTNAPTVTASSTPTGCTVSNGSATANPTGGIAPYTYSWNTTPAQTTPTANNLPVGTYTVVVADANGCSSFATVSVIATSAPTTTSAVNSNVLCNGGNTGSATTTPTGGTPGYTYQWIPSGGNAATAGNLTAGNYTVLITDANGCTTIDTLTISQPSAIVLTSTQTNVKCNGGNNASTTATASGGTPGYNYLWSPSGQTTSTATGLSAGTYNCTVTDANGCTKVIPVTITQPNPLTATTSAVNVKCNGGKTGTGTATMNGGSSPYTYVWTTVPPQNTQTATGLGAGTYTVTITDANGCTSKTTVTVTQPQPITLSISCGDSICAGDTTSLSATVAGGTPSYTYVWLPGPKNGSAISVNPTSSTTYTVTVVDANGCTSATPKNCTVTVLPAPNANFDTTSSGTFSSTFLFPDLSTGGTSWSWNFGDNSASSSLQNPVHTFPGAGTYTVTQIVHNQFGCPDTFKLVIKIGEGILIPNVFTPDGDGTNDVWYIPNSGMKEFHVEIYDRWGAKVFETTADEIRWDGRSQGGKPLSDGTYYYVLHAILKSGAIGKNYSTNGYVTLLTKK